MLSRLRVAQACCMACVVLLACCGEAARVRLPQKPKRDNTAQSALPRTLRSEDFSQIKPQPKSDLLDLFGGVSSVDFDSLFKAAATSSTPKPKFGSSKVWRKGPTNKNDNQGKGGQEFDFSTLTTAELAVLERDTHTEVQRLQAKLGAIRAAQKARGKTRGSAQKAKGEDASDEDETDNDLPLGLAGLKTKDITHALFGDNADAMQELGLSVKLLEFDDLARVLGGGLASEKGKGEQEHEDGEQQQGASKQEDEDEDEDEATWEDGDGFGTGVFSLELGVDDEGNLQVERADHGAQGGVLSALASHLLGASLANFPEDEYSGAEPVEVEQDDDDDEEEGEEGEGEVLRAENKGEAGNPSNVQTELLSQFIKRLGPKENKQPTTNPKAAKAAKPTSHDNGGQGGKAKRRAKGRSKSASNKASPFASLFPLWGNNNDNGNNGNNEQDTAQLREDLARLQKATARMWQEALGDDAQAEIDKQREQLKHVLGGLLGNQFERRVQEAVAQGLGLSTARAGFQSDSEEDA